MKEKARFYQLQKHSQPESVTVAVAFIIVLPRRLSSVTSVAVAIILVASRAPVVVSARVAVPPIISIAR